MSVNPTIWNWPGLSPASKVVWSRLWIRAGEQPQRLTVTTAEIANPGLSDRQVRRAFRNIQAAGGMTIFDWPASGIIDLYLAQPEQIARARVVTPDPQTTLFSEPEDDDGPAEGPANPSVRFTADSGEPAPIGDSLREAINAATGPDRGPARKRELINYITSAVRDPDMHPAIAERAAAAVVDHGLGMHVLESVVESTRRKREEGTIETSAGRYFHYRVRKEITGRGLPWSGD